MPIILTCGLINIHLRLLFLCKETDIHDFPFYSNALENVVLFFSTFFFAPSTARERRASLLTPSKEHFY